MLRVTRNDVKLLCTLNQENAVASLPRDILSSAFSLLLQDEVNQSVTVLHPKNLFTYTDGVTQHSVNTPLARMRGIRNSRVCWTISRSIASNADATRMIS